ECSPSCSWSTLRCSGRRRSVSAARGSGAATATPGSEPCRSSIPAARVITHRADHNVATLFRQLQRVRTHHGALIATQSVKRNDEWILLILTYLRGNEDGIGKFFVRICETVSALLNARIDSRAASTALTGCRSSSRPRLLTGLLRELNLYRSNQESRGQRSN